MRLLRVHRGHGIARCRPRQALPRVGIVPGFSEGVHRGGFLAFNCTRASPPREIDAFFRKSGKAIIALTVREIFVEEISRMPA